MGCCGAKDSSTVECLSSVEMPLLEMNRKVETNTAPVGELVTLVLDEDEVPNAEVWKEKSPSFNYGARLRAINGAIDNILLPMNDQLERCAGSKGDKTWDQVSLQDVSKLLAAVLPKQHADAQKALHKLVGIIQFLWDNILPECHSQQLFVNKSLNQLASVLQLTIGRRVVLENRKRSQQLLDDWSALCTLLLGHSDDSSSEDSRSISCCLDSSSKAALLYTSNIAARGEMKFSFTTAREAPLDDGLAQAESRDIFSNACQPTKLFPTFRADATGVEQGEGHGPRKEYFALVGQQLLKEATALDDKSKKTQVNKFAATDPIMRFNRSAGMLWLNEQLSESRANRARVRYLGWLLAQAVCNRTSLGVPLPELLFLKLITGESFNPTIEQLRAFDPEAAKSIEKVLQLSSSELADLCEIEGLPAETSAADFVNHSVRTMLMDSVEWQSEALLSGWVLGLDAMDLPQWAMTAADLCSVVCGPTTAQLLPLRQLFRVVEDQELTECPQLLLALWEAVDKLDQSGQAKLMHFVTGSSRAPIPGTELLRVEMAYVATEAKDPSHALHRLPQAHSCENMLELPNYWAALQRLSKGQAPEHEEVVRVVSERLAVACEFGEGYALDELPGVASVSLQPSSPTFNSSSQQLPYISAESSSTIHTPAYTQPTETQPTESSWRNEQHSVDSWQGGAQQQQQQQHRSRYSSRSSSSLALPDRYTSAAPSSSRMYTPVVSERLPSSLQYNNSNNNNNNYPAPNAHHQYNMQPQQQYNSNNNNNRRALPHQSLGMPAADMSVMSMGQPLQPPGMGNHNAQHRQQVNRQQQQQQDAQQLQQQQDELDSLLEDLDFAQ